MDIGIGLGDEAGPSGIRDQKVEEEYHFEVLSTEQIVQHMVESIKEVNSVIQVSSGGTMVRMVALRWSGRGFDTSVYFCDNVASVVKMDFVANLSNQIATPP